MNDLLKRMISRTNAPLSPVQPILPSVFANVSPTEIASEVVVSSSIPERRSSTASGREIRPPEALHDERALSTLAQPPDDDAHDTAPKFVLHAPVRPDTSGTIIDAAAAAPQHVSVARTETGGPLVNQADSEWVKPRDTPQLPPGHGGDGGAGVQLKSFEPVAEMPPPTRNIRPQLQTTPAAVIGVAQERFASAIFGEVAQPAASRPAKTEVFISIDHIEVRSAPRAEPPSTPKQRHKVTLQSYLGRRKEDAL